MACRRGINHPSAVHLIEPDRLHADGERILKPLHLSDEESGDLVAFLESLSPDGPQPAPASPPVAPGCGR